MSDILDLIMQLLGAACTIKETMNNEKITRGSNIKEYNEIKVEPKSDPLKWENLGRIKVEKRKKTRKKRKKIL